MPADEPTLGEVARTLNRFVEDTQRRFAELTADNQRRYAELNTTIGILVTRDLYEAHRTALLEDIAQLRDELKAEREGRAADKKTDQDSRAADRRMVQGALIAAGLSLAVTLIAAALVLALGLK